MRARGPALKPNEDNERLEFLGDRVLGLAVAELLTETFPEASEGELARRFNQLVRAETCAEIAHRWELGDAHPDERRRGGERRPRQEDHPRQCLRGGARRDLHRWRLSRRRATSCCRFWAAELSELDAAAPDAKSVLQEWAQGRRLSLPRYLEVAREGPDHAPRFTAEVQIDGVAPERGHGANKRAAEQAAALAMLLREGVWQAPRCHD